VWDYNEGNRPANVVRGRFGKTFGIAAAWLATAAALVVVFLGPIRDRRAMHSLVAAHAGLAERPVDGRLSADFEYHPQKQRFRSGTNDPKDAEWSLKAAAAATLETTRDAHLAGVAALLLEDYDEAVVRLTEAANADPNDARVVSDLAAAYYARWQHRGDDADLASAREKADRAWSLARTPQTAWNRALALDTPEAWKKYLELDSTSPWAEEARERSQNVSP
jgi:hypothetical protein